MPGENAGHLAEYVRARRLQRGLTQEALAERAGLTVDTIGALERGLRRRLYPHTARAIADALGLSDDERTTLSELAHSRVRPPVSPVSPQPPFETDAPGSPLSESEVSPALRHNLPTPLTRLIGRESQLRQIAERLSEVRLLTLAGPGGVGKTRLAVESARQLVLQYPDGVWLVELASVTDPAAVLSSIASVLGVRETPGRSSLETLSLALRSRRLLLLLDNCEQLLGAATELGALLGACPLVTVLATSRSPLHLSGEYELLVPPLDSPPEDQAVELEAAARSSAVMLFVERAASVRAGFSLTPENAADVATICSRLDGLPLALELAAARVKLLPPQALLTRLDQRLSLLTGGAQDRPDRQRTLRAAIAWSYDLLSPPEQQTFRALGAFSGGFALSAAESVCGVNDAEPLLVVEQLTSLLDQSLVQRDDATDPAAVGLPGDVAAEDDDPRFSTFETICEFAAEQLEAEGEAPSVHRRHGSYYLRLAEQAAAGLDETSAIAAAWRTRRRLQRESPNLRAALKRAIADGRQNEALRLATALCALWVPFGNLRVARRWVGQSSGTFREARQWLERALAMEPPLADAVRARALFGLGRVLLFQWDELATELRSAVRAFEESLKLFRELGDTSGIAVCLLELGWASLDQGDLAYAREMFEESLSLCHGGDDLVGAGWAMTGLGRVALAENDPERAASHFEDAREYQEGAANQLGIAALLDGLGLARQAQHLYAEALECFEEAVALRRTAGAQSGLAAAFQRLGVLLGVRGETGRAAELLRESLTLSYTMGAPWDVANALISLGALSGSTGLPETAARLCGAGEALMTARGLVFPDSYGSLYARTLVALRRALGDGAFESLHRDGAALALDEAVALALHTGAPGEVGTTTRR